MINVTLSQLETFIAVAERHGFHAAARHLNVSQSAVSLRINLLEQRLGCDFDLPTGTKEVDFSKVSVKVTAGGAASLPGRVSTEAACGKDAAWHFDVDPATGATPKQVQLCPTTCAAVKADPQAKVDIVLGCKDTIVLR